ncbi:hypothetical protein V1477_002293 [Vespula maculifrons]|uniref:Uncharacterized protein n=1 Tax=Vespula maculifrons TaxID=7453 RepID=A0ABD2CW30_VESMC
MPKKREKAIRREKQVRRKKKSQRQKEDEERKDPPFGGGDGDGGGDGGDGGGDGGGEKCLEYKLTRLPLIHSDPFYLENSSRKGCSISWKTKVLLYLSAHPKYGRSMILLRSSPVSTTYKDDHWLYPIRPSSKERKISEQIRYCKK